jgi:hypothetical protein
MSLLTRIYIFLTFLVICFYHLWPSSVDTKCQAIKSQFYILHLHYSLIKMRININYKTLYMYSLFKVTPYYFLYMGYFHFNFLSR